MAIISSKQTMNTTPSEIQTATEIAMKIAKPQEVIVGKKRANFVIVPKDCQLQEVPLAAPELEKNLTAAFDDLESFTRYVNEHKSPETRIFSSVNDAGGSFRAILDFHGKDKPNTCMHFAVYGCPHSTEWKNWNDKNEEGLSQLEFAQFLEENQVDVIQPSGAEILEIALTLEAKTSVQFSSGHKLQNGNQKLMFQETTEAVAGEKGDLVIPSIFKLFIPPFVNSARAHIDARLRYRISNGKATFWYELVRPQDVIREACAKVIAEIYEKTTIQPFIGRIN